MIEYSLLLIINITRPRRINSPVNSWRRISAGRSSIVSCASSFQVGDDYDDDDDDDDDERVGICCDDVRQNLILHRFTKILRFCNSR